MARLMGIDYGARRVGVALSDEAGQFAFAKAVLENDENLLDTIAEICAQEKVERIIVGESDNPAGGMNTIMRRISIFARALGVRTELPIDSEGEAYTSALARRAFGEEMTRSTRRQLVDAAAAALILQQYIDTRRS